MTATVGEINVSEGQGKIIATYEFTDSDSNVKELQRITLSTSSGAEITDGNGNVPTHEQYIPGYEDNSANVAKVESRYSYSPEIIGGINTIVSSAAGYIDHVNVSADKNGAGTIIIRDSATLGSGTTIKTIYLNADGTHSQNFDVPFHCPTITGIEVDFTGYTGNVAIQVFKR